MTFSIKTFSTFTTQSWRQRHMLKQYPNPTVLSSWSPSERCSASQRRRGLTWTENPPPPNRRPCWCRDEQRRWNVYLLQTSEQSRQPWSVFPAWFSEFILYFSLSLKIIQNPFQHYLLLFNYVYVIHKENRKSVCTGREILLLYPKCTHTGSPSPITPLRCLLRDCARSRRQSL